MRGWSERGSDSWCRFKFSQVLHQSPRAFKVTGSSLRSLCLQIKHFFKPPAASTGSICLAAPTRISADVFSSVIELETFHQRICACCVFTDVSVEINVCNVSLPLDRFHKADDKAAKLLSPTTAIDRRNAVMHVRAGHRRTGRRGRASKVP